jgi:hypothetical protein
MHAPIMAHTHGSGLFYGEFTRIGAEASVAAGTWVRCVAAY